MSEVRLIDANKLIERCKRTPALSNILFGLIDVINEQKTYEEYKEKKENSHKTSDDIAFLLVQLYADYKHHCGCDNYDYAEAVAVAIRMLVD